MISTFSCYLTVLSHPPYSPMAASKCAGIQTTSPPWIFCCWNVVSLPVSKCPNVTNTSTSNNIVQYTHWEKNPKRIQRIHSIIIKGSCTHLHRTNYISAIVKIILFSSFLTYFHHFKLRFNISISHLCSWNIQRKLVFSQWWEWRRWRQHRCRHRFWPFWFYWKVGLVKKD